MCREPAAADEPPAKEGTAEPPKPPGKLKETIFTAADGEEKRENGGAVLATPTSATGPKRHIGISLQTPRGAEFDVNEVDPSGTKGSGNPLKYTPGQVCIPDNSDWASRWALATLADPVRVMYCFCVDKLRRVCLHYYFWL